MYRVQVIGLPGAGKTEGISRFFQNHSSLHIDYLDIRNYLGRYRERLFKDAIRASQLESIIAESACGVLIPSFVIKLDTPIDLVYQQLKNRDQYIDCDYLSLLSSTMVSADRTIRDVEELPSLLKSLLI